MALFRLHGLRIMMNQTKKIEEAFKRGLADFNHVKDRYELAFNMKNAPFEYEVGYEKSLLCKLNKDFKKVRSYKLPWFMKTYTDFIEEKFKELMVIYKNGGWK